MKMLKTIIIFVIFADSLMAAANEKFSFLFLGDLHYHYPQFRTSKIVNAIAADIKAKGLKIDLVCHIGDLIENQRKGHPVSLETGAKEWEYAIKDIKKNFEVPFFMCLGNHEWYGDNSWFGGLENIQKYYYPFMAKELGRSLNGKPFFSFRWKNSFFLFTNHAGYDIGLDKEQRVWLKKNLDYAHNNPAIKHIFIFGHPGIWNFSYMRFNENGSLVDIMNKYTGIDAYFCGHTHHNNASVWDLGSGRKLLQINGSPKGGSESSNYSIGEHELILNPPPSKRGYVKGFGTLNAYFIVSVDGEQVNVSLESIGGKRIWEFSWTSPGEIKEKLFTGEKVRKVLKKEQLKNIKSARLHIFPYVPEKIFPDCYSIRITVNGKKVGELPRKYATWHLSNNKNFIAIPPELVKIKNRIAISNPNNEHFAVRDCYLEAVLENKEKILTPVYPYVLFAGKWQNIYMNFGLCHPTSGVLYSDIETNIPEELIKCAGINEEMIFELNFKDTEEAGEK
ncbi:MAG: metallophosphoesterase [Victivallaceae bacterium]|nr:metallophosphoesterase [Victivallaceae bacterium]